MTLSENQTAADSVPDQFPPLAIELGWLRAMGALRDAVNAMPNRDIDRQELLSVIAYLAKNPQTY